MKAGESEERTRFAVLCPYHGRVYLTKAEYNLQMLDSNNLWKCPRILKNATGNVVCLVTSEFDDDTYESEVYDGVFEKGDHGFRVWWG